MRDIIIGFTPFPEEEPAVNNKKIGIISTENVSQYMQKKDMYTDDVRNQPCKS